MQGRSITTHIGWLMSTMLAMVTLGLLVATTSAAEAQVKSLDDALGNLANNIARVIKERQDEASVSIGVIADPDGLSGGQAIKQRLEEKLKTQGLEVKKRGAAVQVRGDYSIEKAAAGHVIGIRTELTEGRTGAALSKINEKVFIEKVTKLDDVLGLIGVTVDTTTEASPLGAREKVAEKIDKPTVAIATENATSTVKSVVSAEAGSPYQVQILLKVGTDAATGAPQFKSLDATNEGGEAFVRLEKDQIYAVRIINKATDHDVAVQVLIDGVSAFVFSQNEALKKHDRFVIDREKAGTLRGWHDTGNKFFEFVVSDKAAAGKLDAPSSSVGTISVLFFPSWRVDEDQPTVERKALRSKGLSTQKGSRVDAPAEVVERHFGVTLLASVSVRYDQVEPAKPAATAQLSR
jgi:hypothetical protein